MSEIQKTDAERIALAPPSQVGLLAPAQGAIGVLTTPTLSWQPTDRATTYQVVVSRNSAFTDLVLNQDGSSTSVAVSVALAENTQHWWRVRGTNAAGPGPWSDSRTFSAAAPVTHVITIGRTNPAIGLDVPANVHNGRLMVPFGGSPSAYLMLQLTSELWARPK